MTQVSRSSVSFIFLLAVYLAPFSGYAMNVSQYQDQLEAAKSALANAHAQLEAARKKVEHAEEIRNRKLKEKEDLIRSVNPRLRESAGRTSTVVQAELNWVRQQRAILERVNSSYLQKQNEQSLSVGDLIRRLQVYKNAEMPRKENLREWIRLAQNETEQANLVDPVFKLTELNKAEISDRVYWSQELRKSKAQILSNYEDCKANLTQLKKFMEKYRISRIPPPTDAAERLELFLRYVEARGNFFVEQTRQGIQFVENKIRDLIVNQVDGRMSQLAKSELQTTLSLAFSSAANDLMGKNTALGRSTQTSVGCTKLLKPYVSFFKEVLTFKELCENISELRRSKSHHLEGCILLKPLIDEAQEFFDSEAELQVRITESLARLDPAAAENEQELTKLSSGLAQRAPLGDLIHFHDEFMSKWVSALADVE